MTMTYTEALRKSRGLNKTAALPELEGWQRAGIGGLGGGLLTAGLTSLVAPKASTKSKLLAALIGAGGGAAAGYRYLPGYGASKDVAEAPASAPAEEKPDAAAASATPVASGGETKGEDKDKREAPTGKPSPDAPSGGGRPGGGGDGGGNDDGGGVGLRELLGGAAAVEGGRRLWKKYRGGKAGGNGPASPGPSGTGPSGSGPSGSGGPSGAGSPSSGNSPGKGAAGGGSSGPAGPGSSGSGPSGTGPTPSLGGPSGADSPRSGNSSGKGVPGGGGKATTMSVEDLRREQEMEYRSRMRLDPDVLPDITHFDPAGYQLDKMGPRNAAKFLREVGLGFDPRVPREVQLKALQSAYRRNLELSHGPIGGDKYWVTLISKRIRQKAREALKASDPQFKDRLREDLGQRAYEMYRTDLSYVPVIYRGGKYGLRKLDPFETLDPLTAASQDDRDRRAAIMKGTPNVWNAKHYGGRLRPGKLSGTISGWVPEMAPSAESKSVRAARLARAVNAGSRLLPILRRTLDN